MSIDKLKATDKRTGKNTIHRRQGVSEGSRKSRYSLQQAFAMFMQAKSGERLRELTLRDYRNHFRYIEEWLQEGYSEIQYVDEIDPPLIRAYIHYLSFEKPLYAGHPYRMESERKGLSPGAVNVRINTLKAMFRWFHQEGLISVNPTQNLSRQRVEEDRIGAFTDEQVQRLLEQPDQKTYAGFRDYVLMKLLLESGVRINEALSLEVSDVDLQSRIITLAGSKNKNRRLRIVPMSAGLLRMFIDLIAEKETYFPDTKRIFLANYGEPLSKTTITHRIKQYGIKAGIAGQVRCSPHTFRHTFAKRFLTFGGDIIALQRILGHSSMEMVRKYVQHTPDDLLEAHDRFTASLKLGKRRNL